MFRITVLSVLLQLIAAGPLAAQVYPSKPIHTVVGFAPGGGGDTGARLLAEKLSAAIGQPVIVDNRPGAGGLVATNYVAKSPPDGYTVISSTPGSTILAPAQYKQVPFDPAKDLTAVATVFSTPFIILAGPGLKAANLKEVIDFARANPGKLSYGHPGLGSIHHLSMEVFKQKLGLEIQAVAYKGGSLAVQDTIGGQIPLVITAIVPNTDGLIKSGRLRAVAVTTRERNPDFPDTPAVAEVIPGYEALAMVGWWVPTGTPQPALEKLNAELLKVLRSPDLPKKYREIGFQVEPRTVAETNQYWRGELAIWPDVIRRLNIPME